jgi:hypothetical protein
MLWMYSVQDDPQVHFDAPATSANTTRKFKFRPLDCHYFLDKHKKNSSITEDPNDGKVFARYMDLYNPGFWISNNENDKAVFRTGVLPPDKDNVRLLDQVLSKQPHSSFRRVVVVGGGWGWFPLMAASRGYHVDVFQSESIRLCESSRLNRFTNDENTLAAPSLNIYSSPIGLSSTHKSKLNTIAMDEFGQDHGWITTSTSSSSNTDMIAVLKLEGGLVDQVIQSSQKLLVSRVVEYIWIEDWTDADLACVNLLHDASYRLWSTPTDNYNKIIQDENDPMQVLEFINKQCGKIPCSIWWKRRAQ